MKSFDVIIIGAGPAGLQCAKTLAGSRKNVLLVEKNKIIGPKVCAGGLTRKCFNYLQLPDHLVERTYQKIIFQTPFNKTALQFGENFLYTVDRKNLGQWQLEKLHSAENIEIKTGSAVTEFKKNHITVNGSEKIGYKYLVGADGSNSSVRRFLGVKTKLTGIAFQYIIPGKKFKDIQIFLNSRLFGAWYAWIFPYKNSASIGYGCFPMIISPKKAKENFFHWIKSRKIDLSQGEYQAAAINCDYRGHKFGNIFLAGDAAGLASGLTGEGIYQALVSGEEIAKLILNPSYKCEGIKKARAEIRIHKILLVTIYIFGPLRWMLYEIVVLAVKNKFLARILLRVLT